MSEAKYRYFSPAEKCVVTRYGSDSMIGAIRTPQGFVVNPEVVVAIPVNEVQRYAKEYRSDLRNQSLIERTEQDFNAYQESRRPKPTQAPSPTTGDDDASDSASQAE